MGIAGQGGRGAAAALLLATLVACSVPASNAPAKDTMRETPRRIVSINPCIDAVLREVADPAQIAGISHYSQDARATSVPLDWARRFRAVGDGAEDVIAAHPDLVLAGPHVAPQTVAALGRLGVRLVRLGVPTTVEDSRAQVTEIGRITGQQERARTLNARGDGAIAAAASDDGPNTTPSALIWQDGGLVPGKGTLANELLVRAGFRSTSEALGLAQWDMVSLERLLSVAPDIVMTGSGGMDAGAGGRGGTHPVLRRAVTHITFTEFPSRMLHCGGPVIIDATAHLTRIRNDWQRRGGI